MRLVVAGSIVLLTLLVSCSSPAPQVAEIQTLEPTAAPTQTTEPIPAETDVDEGQPEGGPQPCGEQTLVAIERIINSQIIAFGSGDYELAYEFASPFFKATVTLEGFVQITEGSYGPLISSSSLVFPIV